MRRSHLIAGLACAALILAGLLLFSSDDDRAVQPFHSPDDRAAREWMDPASDQTPDQEEAPYLLEPEVSAANVRVPIPPRPGDAPSWRVEGRVIDEDGAPLPGAKVQLRYHGSGNWVDADPSLTGDPILVRCGDDGSYTARLPAPVCFAGTADADSVPGGIIGLASAPGHLPEESRTFGKDSLIPLKDEYNLPLPVPSAKTVRLDFKLLKATVISGRVLDPRGSPVFGAEVEVRYADRKQNASGKVAPKTSLEGKEVLDAEMRAKLSLRLAQRAWRTLARTDAEGVYFIPVDRPGRYDLSAVKEGVGVANTVSVTIDAARDRTAPNLYLRGPGSISGRVVYPDGEPAGIVTITANLIDDIERTPGTPSSDEQVRPRFEGLNGTQRCEVMSDEAGRFDIKGLHPGRYSLEVTTFPDNIEYPGGVLTGQHDICFVLDLRHLLIIVRDELGRPVPRAGTYWDPVSDRGDLEEGAKYFGEVYGGWMRSQIEPGSWVIWAGAEGRETVRKELVVKERDYRNRLEFDLPRYAPSGEVVLTVRDSDGEPVKEIEAAFLSRSDSFCWHDVPYYSCKQKNDSGEYILSVPAGSYNLKVYPRGECSVDGMRHLLPICFPGTAERISVEAGRMTASSLTLEKGGLLRFTIRLEKQLSNRFKPRFLLHPAGGEPLELRRFRIPGEDRTTWSNRIVPGTDYVVENALHQGAYVLEGGSYGYETVNVRFNILPGKVTPVEVLLRPE